MRSSIHFPITVLFVILTEAIIRGGFKPDLVEVETDEHIVEAVQRPHPELAILPGELPGYTGWARPITTLADYFVSKFPSTPIVAGEQFSFQVECSHEECSKGGSLFFVRAYGPAILTGTMKDHHNGTYTVSFLPHDGGSYQLEVVITCSRRVKLNDFPTADQPGYEGYLLPGYPKSIQVVTSSPLSESKTDDLPICTGKEILQTTQLSALEQARWVVASKLRNRPFSANSTLEEADTKKYAKGVGGIGFRMKYEPRNECRWLSATELQETRTINKIRAKSKLVDKPLHIVFIGDSNMFRVMYSFEKHYEKQLPWHLTKIPTHGGLHMRMDRIQTALDELTLLDHKFIILFNSGLHDILQLCFKDRAEFREETFNRTDDKISCAREYKDIVAKFVDMVEKFPAIHRVWQTTTAGWPKYGNFGNAWPTWEMQRFPLDPGIVLAFNDIIWPMLQDKNIPTMDGYWLTLARPDHREAITKKEQNVGKRLAHAGPEVYNILSTQFLMLILEKLDPDFTQNFQ